jgi:hypothetical protein
LRLAYHSSYESYGLCIDPKRKWKPRQSKSTV